MDGVLGKRGLVALIASVTLCLLAALPQAASASFSGRPGVIVFNLTRSGGLHPRGELYAIQPWQSEPRQLTWNAYDSDPSFAPSGQRFAFTRSQPSKAGVYLYEFSTGRVTRLAAGSALQSPAFGRRGMVAFTRSTPIGRDLFLRTADGRIRRLTATSGVKEEEPVFTPDGKRIVFLRRPGSFRHLEIWSIRANGGDLGRIDARPYAYYNPDISPNGHWLAVESLVGFNTTPVIQISLGSEESRSGFGDAANPAYSPGGGKIAFSNREGIWLAPTEGGRDSESLIYRTGEGFRGGGNPWPTNLAWQPLPK